MWTAASSQTSLSSDALFAFSGKSLTVLSYFAPCLLENSEHAALAHAELLCGLQCTCVALTVELHDLLAKLIRDPLPAALPLSHSVERKALLPIFGC